jgi:hypothetical protein
MIPHVFPKYCIISRPLARGCFNSIQFLCFIAWAFPSCSFADDVLIKNQRVPMGHTPFLAAQIVEVFSSPCCTSAVLPGLASMSAALTLVRRLRALGWFGFWLLRSSWCLSKRSLLQSARTCPRSLCGWQSFWEKAIWLSTKCFTQHSHIQKTLACNNLAW